MFLPRPRAQKSLNEEPAKQAELKNFHLRVYFEHTVGRSFLNVASQNPASLIAQLMSFYFLPRTYPEVEHRGVQLTKKNREVKLSGDGISLFKAVRNFHLKRNLKLSKFILPSVKI